MLSSHQRVMLWRGNASGGDVGVIVDNIIAVRQFRCDPEGMLIGDVTAGNERKIRVEQLFYYRDRLPAAKLIITAMVQMTCSDERTD